MKTIEERLKELPPQLLREVEDFLELLAQKKGRKAGKKLRQDWAGALRDYRDQYTSPDLQKKTLEWRGEWGRSGSGGGRIRQPE